MAKEQKKPAKDPALEFYIQSLIGMAKDPRKLVPDGTAADSERKHFLAWMKSYVPAHGKKIYDYINTHYPQEVERVGKLFRLANVDATTYVPSAPVVQERPVQAKAPAPKAPAPSSSIKPPGEFDTVLPQSEEEPISQTNPRVEAPPVTQPVAPATKGKAVGNIFDLPTKTESASSSTLALPVLPEVPVSSPPPPLHPKDILPDAETPTAEVQSPAPVTTEQPVQAVAPPPAPAKVQSPAPITTEQPVNDALSFLESLSPGEQKAGGQTSLLPAPSRPSSSPSDVVDQISNPSPLFPIIKPRDVPSLETMMSDAGIVKPDESVLKRREEELDSASGKFALASALGTLLGGAIGGLSGMQTSDGIMQTALPGVEAIRMARDSVMNMKEKERAGYTSQLGKYYDALLNFSKIREGIQTQNQKAEMENVGNQVKYLLEQSKNKKQNKTVRTWVDKDNKRVLSTLDPETGDVENIILGDNKASETSPNVMHRLVQAETEKNVLQDQLMGMDPSINLDEVLQGNFAPPKLSDDPNMTTVQKATEFARLKTLYDLKRKYQTAYETMYNLAEKYKVSGYDRPVLKKPVPPALRNVRMTSGKKPLPE